MWRSRLLVILAASGLVISAYLTLKSADPASVICGVGGCEKVLSSQYAYLFGLPVAGYGLAWYLGILGLTYLTITTRNLEPIWLYLLAVAGLLFSLYLLWVSRFVIGAYCPWCLTSLGLVVLINLLVFTVPRR